MQRRPSIGPDRQDMYEEEDWVNNLALLVFCPRIFQFLLSALTDSLNMTESAEELLIPPPPPSPWTTAEASWLLAFTLRKESEWN